MTILIEGFTLGLSTGPYCLAACGPFLLPYILSERKESLAGSAIILARFLSGRLIAYLLFAVIAGAAGVLAGPALPSWVPPAAMTITASLMLLYVFTRSFPKLSACAAVFPKALEQKMPFAAGFLTGINVCPPFVAGFIRLVAIGSVLKGMAFFTAFFAATSLYTLPVLLAVPWLGERLQNIGRMALILSGLWYLLTGIKGLM